MSCSAMSSSSESSMLATPRDASINTTQPAFHLSPPAKPHPVSTSWSDAEEVLGDCDTTDDADDETSPSSTFSMEGKLRQSTSGGGGLADHIVVHDGVDIDGEEDHSVYRSKSIFVENIEHDVTADEIRAFLSISEASDKVDDTTPKPRSRSKLTKPAPALSPRHSLNDNSFGNLLTRVISPRNVGSSSAPAPSFARLRPGVGIRSQTSPHELPTRNRVQSQGVDDVLSSRRSSLNVIPDEQQKLFALAASRMRSSESKAGRPKSTLGSALGYDRGSPREHRKSWLDGGHRDAPSSPSKKRPLAGLFRRVSTKRNKDAQQTRTQPIRESIVVTAPTPTRPHAVERSVSTRRGRISSATVPTHHLRPVSGDSLATAMPPRSSSSMDEARSTETRPHSPFGRHDTIDSTTGSSSGRSHTSSGGWKYLWRKKKTRVEADVVDLTLPGLTHGTVGRPRASTVGSNSDSSVSRRGAPLTPTTSASLAPAMDVSVITGPSGCLPRIEEDGQVEMTRAGAMSVLVTDVSTSTTADVVVIPPSMTEESFEDIIANQHTGLKDDNETWATPPTSPDAEPTARYSLFDRPVSSMEEHNSPATTTITDEPAQVDIREDKIEVMIVPSAITGRPKPRVFGSWPSLGNPRPVTLKSIERPPRRKSNAGQWLSSNSIKDGIVRVEPENSSSSAEVTEDEDKH